MRGRPGTRRPGRARRGSSTTAAGPGAAYRNQLDDHGGQHVDDGRGRTPRPGPGAAEPGQLPEAYGWRGLSRLKYWERGLVSVPPAIGIIEQLGR
jgi:hypothetical protein